MPRLTKNYTSEEMQDVLNRLKDICKVYLDQDKDIKMKNERPIENWIVLALHKHGYRIVKVG